MGSRYGTKIKEGARSFLQSGEEVQASIIAQPRGTQAMATAGVAGVVASTLVGGKAKRNADAAAKAGFQLTKPMALAESQHRLLVFKIGSPIGFGIGGDVKELVSAVPVNEVDRIEVKWFGLAKIVTVTVRGVPVVLEAAVTVDAKGLVAAVERAKTAASAPTSGLPAAVPELSELPPDAGSII